MKKLKTYLTRKVAIPETNPETFNEVEIIETWEVRWVSMHESMMYAPNVRHEVRVFNNESDAIEFKETLLLAKNLLNDNRRVHLNKTRDNMSDRKKAKEVMKAWFNE